MFASRLRYTSVRHSRAFSDSVKDWLAQKGYDSKTIKSVTKQFRSGGLTTSDLNMMGDAGVKDFIAAIKRQDQKVVSTEFITINVNVPHEREKFTVQAPVGETFYSLAKSNDELGAYLECSCSGNAACSTCHIIIDEKDYGRLPTPEEDELDMLDLAAAVVDTSRLGCQIQFTKALDGLSISIPEDVNDLYEAQVME